VAISLKYATGYRNIVCVQSIKDRNANRTKARVSMARQISSGFSRARGTHSRSIISQGNCDADSDETSAGRTDKTAVRELRFASPARHRSETTVSLLSSLVTT